jgi:hypothetical protein
MKIFYYKYYLILIVIISISVSVCSCKKNSTKSESDPLTLLFYPEEVSRLGGRDGSINLIVIGGTSPYSYLWSNGFTSEDISSLTTGVYAVTVTDQDGNMVIDSTTVALSIFSNTYIPGNTYYDSTGYVEYRAGNLPIIISTPHGGDLEPQTIPSRNCSECAKRSDGMTKPITEGMYNAFIAQTGCYPHVIINLLHRKKFDANRDIGEAADGNPTVEQAWYGYHEFINSAKSQVISDYSRGLFLDIHGHSHTIQRIELGYLLRSTELNLSDSMLNTTTYINESSIRTLVGDNIQSISHSELLRGLNSFGTLLDDNGFPSVPSLSNPFPEPYEEYFAGGYNTQRHSSRNNGGEIDAIQVELNRDIRFDPVRREMLINALTTSANQYIDLHYNDQFMGHFCNLILSN